MASLLRRINEELLMRLNYHRDLPNKHEFITLINLLSIDEKCFIVKKFCEYEWNIGSIRILSILQNCKLLTATEYILRQDDDEHIKLVLNDFLEAEYILLANLVENFCYSLKKSMKLKLYLEDCFRRLVKDAIENPDVVSVQYLSELKKLVSEKVYLKVISIHLHSLLKMETATVVDCFKNSKKWQDSIGYNKVFCQLIKELITNQKFVLDELFEISSTSNFKGRKYFLIILGVISQQCDNQDSASMIKKYLKDLFKSFVSKSNKELCLWMFAVARTVYRVNSNQNMETYGSWFKNTIGNMRYSINIQNFKYVMSILEEIIYLEIEPEFIQVHINTAINPPTHCNEIVLNYKKICKQHLLALTKKETIQRSDVNKSIVISDDDDDDLI